MLLNLPFPHQPFFVYSLKSISSVHAASVVTSASVAGQYFCTLIKSDMWKLRRLKENNSQIEFCFFSLILKGDYEADSGR